MRKAVDDQREIINAWLQTTGATISIVVLAVMIVLFIYVGFFR
ncbi:hypothetical protein [Ferrimicrobium acidiphilum]|jgi:uncharacterized membrane protein YobD (UPF0266 family)|nr:hypothetical protein [Ferrimicrobium acidiphilum]